MLRNLINWLKGIAERPSARCSVTVFRGKFGPVDVSAVPPIGFYSVHWRARCLSVTVKANDAIDAVEKAEEVFQAQLDHESAHAAAKEEA